MLFVVSVHLAVLLAKSVFVDSWLPIGMGQVLVAIAAAATASAAPAAQLGDEDQAAANDAANDATDLSTFFSMC